jgi:hypothetical protein
LGEPAGMAWDQLLWMPQQGRGGLQVLVRETQPTGGFGVSLAQAG